MGTKVTDIIKEIRLLLNALHRVLHDIILILNKNIKR